VLRSLHSFCTQLAATPLSQAIQSTEWIVPAVQTVHILAVATVITSVLMIDLRLMGFTLRKQSIGAVTSRYLPPVWYALPVLLATGATLIIAEPSRSLQNPIFLLKMCLLLLAAGVTLVCQLPLRQDAGYWEGSRSRRWRAKLIGFLSLPLWIAIVFAGRWIAYVQAK
jgi:hypothetical protein